MRRWVYALTAGCLVLTLFTIASVVALSSEIDALRKQTRLGSAPDNVLSLPRPTAPNLALPSPVPSRDTSLIVTALRRQGNVVTVTVHVQSAVPVSLFSAAPLLADRAGLGYAASAESQDKASIAALDLGARGMADFTLDFPVTASFAPTSLIFNNGSTSTIAPVLRAPVG